MGANRTRNTVAKGQTMPSVKKTAVQAAGANPALDEFAGSRAFEHGGVRGQLDCFKGSQLDEEDTGFCIGLMEANMQVLNACTGGARGGWNAAAKADFMKQLEDPKVHVFMLRAARAEVVEEEEADEWVFVQGPESEDKLIAFPGKQANLGFLLVQVSFKGAIPALLVSEMQIVPEMFGMGLGKHAMEMVNGIASNLGMTLVLLNLLKANAKAMQQHLRATRGKDSEREAVAGGSIPSALPAAVSAH